MADAGELSEKLTIETPVFTVNELGEDIPGWGYHSSPWAKVVETPGREFLKGDYQAEEKAVFKIRFRDLDTTARATWRGRVYDILSVTGTRREGYTYLHCMANDG